MVVFLANRQNLQTKRLHKRLKNRLRAESEFSNARLERASSRDPGAFRAKADANPRRFLDNPEYPTAGARLVVGFNLFTPHAHEHYWLNWIEPDRNLLVGWHQDEMHPELGEIHVQVNDGDTAVAHESARFIDSHPLDVFEQRLEALPTLVESVEWSNGRPCGFRQR